MWRSVEHHKREIPSLTFYFGHLMEVDAVMPVFRQWEGYYAMLMYEVWLDQAL